MERIAEEQVSPLLIQYLPEKFSGQESILTVAYEEGRIQIKTLDEIGGS